MNRKTQSNKTIEPRVMNAPRPNRLKEELRRIREDFREEYHEMLIETERHTDRDNPPINESKMLIELLGENEQQTKSDSQGGILHGNEILDSLEGLNNEEMQHKGNYISERKRQNEEETEMLENEVTEKVEKVELETESNMKTLKNADYLATDRVELKERQTSNRFVQKLKKFKARPLHNKNNSCFFNAAMQFIMHIKKLRKFLTESPADTGSWTKLLQEMIGLYDSGIEEEEYSEVFARFMGRLDLEIGVQHDADEVLQRLMAEIEIEVGECGRLDEWKGLFKI